MTESWIAKAGHSELGALKVYMSRILDALLRLVSVQPIATLAVLFLITIVLGAGIARLEPEADPITFLPKDSPVAIANDKIEELFGSADDTITVTLLFRGDALTPDGLAQMNRTVREIEANPLVAPQSAADTVSPALLVGAALRTNDFTALPQQQIDRVAGQLPGLDRLTGADVDGSLLSIATVTLFKGDTQGAELAIRDIAQASQGPLAVSSLSPAIIVEERSWATGNQMMILRVVSLAVIAVLLLLFTRSFFDSLVSLLGLVMTIIWVTGAQGWLGPGGAGLIGPPNTLTSIVSIILISLVVDYAIQTVGLYREERNIGHSVRDAVRLGLRRVTIPLSLAAVTTIASFLTNLNSPIGANGDFGVVAGLGVACGLVVVLSLSAASRALFDGMRESRGKLGRARLLSDALPGVGPFAEALGSWLARWPVPVLMVVAVITILLGIAATQIEAVFDTKDFLPKDGDAIRDSNALSEAFGGGTGTVNVLIESELTNERTVRNLFDFNEALLDDLRKPDGVVGGVQSSLGLLWLDWITDDTATNPDDKYDAELAAMTEAANDFRLDPAQVQSILDRIEERDPEGFQRVAVDNPNDIDAVLIQFHALTGDQGRAERMVADIDGLWFGDERELTATSEEIIGVEITRAITESQTKAIVSAIVAALVILCLFFWVTKGRPALGFIAVVPIVLVLVWVIGTMALLDIPYNMVTAMITALCIGIGVDYTIHIIHRYEEEFAQRRDPDAAARRTLATTGSALLGSALTTALGIGVLVFSSLAPFQQFGLITAITIVYALVASIVMIPPLMIVWAAYQNYRLRSAVARAERELGDI